MRTEGASAGRDAAACPSGDAGARVKRTRRQGQQATPLESASRRRGWGNGDCDSVFAKRPRAFSSALATFGLMRCDKLLHLPIFKPSTLCRLALVSFA